MSLQLKAGLVITLTIVTLGLLAPWIAPYPWDTIAIKSRFLPPSATHWLGTDEFGRDVLSRLLMGTRLSIQMGVGATLISLIFGVPIGLAAGYFRGRTDEILMRTADVLMAVPPIMLGLLVLAVTPPSLWKTAVTVGFVYIPPIARVTRSVTLSLAGEDFIQAARARAESTSYILFRELLPNAWPALIVEASLRVTYAILLGSALSFLGLGAQPPSSDWGLMISEARAFIDAYFEKYPRVREFRDSVVAQATQDGYVTTLFGRRRAVPQLRSSNRQERSLGERLAVNTVLQGTAADIIKVAMVTVSRELERRKLASRLVLQVHDELVLECPDAEAEEGVALLREAMCSAYVMDPPLEVDVGVGADWLTAKG